MRVKETVSAAGASLVAGARYHRLLLKVCGRTRLVGGMGGSARGRGSKYLST